MGALSDRVEELGERATSSATTAAAARAMADTLADVASGYVRGSIAGRPLRIEPDSRDGVAVVVTGGGYGLADTGRRRAVPAKARPNSALRTPWGPRESVKGSTWAGFGITVRAADDVFDAGSRAVIDEMSG